MHGRNHGMADLRRGRPPRVADTPSERRREFRLTAAEDAALERVAGENGATVADVIRQAVNEFVADYSDRRRPFGDFRPVENQSMPVS